MKIRAVPAAFVEFIHDEAIAVMWPGTEPVAAGVRDRKLLESAVARPLQSAFGKPLYPTVLERAAILFHGLIANHPFHNGNKRAAALTLQLFLAGNDYCLTLEQGELESLARKTASYREDQISHSDMVSEIVHTVRGRTIRVAALKSFPELRELRRGLALMKRAAMKVLELAVLREEFFHPGGPLAPYVE